MIARLAFAIAVLVALAAVPAAAVEFTDAEKQVIAEAVTAFDAAMRAGDGIGITLVVPPRIIDHIAEQYRLDPETLKASMIEQTTELMKTVEFEKFGMDVAQAQYLETPDGMPYAMIPTETVIDFGADGGRMRSVNNTLAILDDGKAYLIRTEDTATVNALRQVYPSFAGVAFIVGMTEMLE